MQPSFDFHSGQFPVGGRQTGPTVSIFFCLEAIAEESGFPTPSFFGYMLYATIVLVPIFLLISLLFFWP